MFLALNEDFHIYLFDYVASFCSLAKLLQSCPTLCDPIDGSLPGSTVPGILQARTLEWVAISFSNAWKWKVKMKSFSRVQFFATPGTVAHQAPPSMGFSRQEYWSGVPLPSPIMWLRSFVFVFTFGPKDLRGCLTISWDVKWLRRSQFLGVGWGTQAQAGTGEWAVKKSCLCWRHLSDHLQPIHSCCKEKGWSKLIKVSIV